MIVCLEGADSVGKSTLAAFLAEQHHARVMHSRVWRDCQKWHAGIIRRAVRLSSAGQLCCLDRIWPSELIYGPIFRGSVAYGDDLAAEFDDAIRSAPGVYVMCVPTDIRGHLARFEERKTRGGEAFDRVEAVAQSYADLLWGNIARPGGNLIDRFCRFGDFAAGRRVIHYDVDRDGRDLDVVARTIMKILNEEPTGTVVPATRGRR